MGTLKFYDRLIMRSLFTGNNCAIINEVHDMMPFLGTLEIIYVV